MRGEDEAQRAVDRESPVTSRQSPVRSDNDAALTLGNVTVTFAARGGGGKTYTAVRDTTLAGVDSRKR